MTSAFAYLVAVIFFVILLNFVVLFMRLRRDRYQRPTKPTMDEEQAAIRRHKEIQRRLDREQEELAYRVEMRNKTLDIYKEVRSKHAQTENQNH